MRPRYWLSTDGKAIVMRRLAITDMAAKVTVERWNPGGPGRGGGAAGRICCRCGQAGPAKRTRFRNGVGADARDGEERKRRQGHPYLFGPMVVGFVKVVILRNRGCFGSALSMSAIPPERKGGRKKFGGRSENDAMCQEETHVLHNL